MPAGNMISRHQQRADRRRTPGAGRSRRGALKSYEAKRAIISPPGRGRPLQCRLAARSLRLLREASAMCRRCKAISPRRWHPTGTALPSLDRLATADPGNADRQRSLSISYEKVGDVLMTQGNLAGALKSYQNSLDHCRKLGQGRPQQRRLAIRSVGIGNERVGEILWLRETWREHSNPMRAS